MIYVVLLSALFFSIECSASWWLKYDLNKTALITSSVADMLVQPESRYKALNVYDDIPVSCEPLGFPCIRAHQCLFNEILTDAALQNDELYGNIQRAPYTVNDDGHFIAKYYTHSKNSVLLSTLQQKGLDLSLVPEPHTTQGNTIVLLWPWHDPISTKTYSAGTRFVRDNVRDTKSSYGIKFIDFENFKPRIALLDKNKAFIEKRRLSAEYRRLIVSIVNKWVGENDGEIPYVLGGSSFTYSALPGFKIKDVNSVKCYIRNEHFKQKSGLDCSELIWRSAAIAGLPFYAKNTFMMKHLLRPLGKKDVLEEGDIILISGHVFLVSNLKKNEIIEAAGYSETSAGYGKVLKTKLNQRFEGICSYRDLISAYHGHKPLIRLSKTGAKTTYKEFKLLKLID